MKRSGTQRLAAVAVAASLALFGCGGGDDGPDDAAPPPDEAPAVTNGTYIEDPEYPLPSLPDEDLATPIAAGTIGFSGIDPGDRGFWTIDAGGGTAQRLDLEGYEGLNAATVAPDGRRIAALGWPPGTPELSSSLVVGSIGARFEAIASEEDLEPWCVRWYPSGERLLLTAFIDGQSDPLLLAVDLDGSAVEAVVPSGRFECAIPIDDERLAITYLGIDTGLLGMMLVEMGNEVVEPLFVPEGCITYGGALSPTGTEIVTSASCDVPADSGIYLIDIETREVEHLLAGAASHPAFSPDGEWIVFTLRPFPGAARGGTWAMRRDGSGFREVAEQAGMHPFWTN